MYKYIIEGNRPLSGKIKAGGNKNAALPCLCAALLTDQKVVLRNIPEIEDVKVMMNVMRELGVEIIDEAEFLRRLGEAVPAEEPAGTPPPADGELPLF